ncbi:heavy-metal-associated domain-containing protein [Corynebacterium sp. c7Ub_26]
MSTHKYKISGMTCSHCERAVRDEVSEIPGIHVDEVSQETGMLTVSSDDDIKDMKVLEAVEEAGYTGTRL